MRRLVLDLETTVKKIDGKIDNSPFNPENKCVSAHFGWLEWDSVEDIQSLVFHHDEQSKPDDPAPLIAALQEADVILAHNAKFDLVWLKQMGLPIPDKVYCTMIGEYVLARGQRISLSLKETAMRHQVTNKKSDLVDELFKSGVGFESMPLETVIEYAEADVTACGEIFLKQLDRYSTQDSQSLKNVTELMNEMLLFLVEIESNGIAVDLDALHEVEDAFRKERTELTYRLTDIVESIMGDSPINLNSGQDMTAVVYSRRVNDRELHRETFNIGVGATGKPLRPPRMNKTQFNNAVRKTTSVVKRTKAVQCTECNGRGKIRKIKKDGTPFKKENNCSKCKGAGALYEELGQTAGLKLVPKDASFASINGFKTDKGTIKLLISQAEDKGNELAVEFLTKLTRLNAISNYLDTFVTGINTWTRATGLLHSSFNQTVTATGRLSSSNPNFQNIPKKIALRKAVVSRFPGGTVTESDYSQLEFRIAGELSQDQQIIDDILTGKDVHRQTASIIFQCKPEDVTSDMRGRAKAYTFSPTFGGMGFGEPEHVQTYFKQFYVLYSGLKSYQRKCENQVLKTGSLQTPSGRQFYWPNVRRLKNGRTSASTMIYNYPIQSLSTADIVPLACIRCLRKFRELDLKSKLILSVHDSICVDTHPDELDQVKSVLVWAMRDVGEEIKDRWDYELSVPLDIEISNGPNWNEQTELQL